MELGGNLIQDPFTLNGIEGGSTNLPLNAPSRALEASRVVAKGPRILYGVTVTNTNAAAQYVQFFDSDSVPADTAVPLLAAKVPAGDVLGITWLPGRTFLTGIVVCNSTTQATKTVGAADCLFDVQYV